MNDDTVILACMPVALARHIARNSYHGRCELCQTTIWISEVSKRQLVAQSPDNHAFVCLPCASRIIDPGTPLIMPNKAGIDELRAHGVDLPFPDA